MPALHRFPHCPHCQEQVIPDTRWCPACGDTLEGLSHATNGDRPFTHGQTTAITCCSRHEATPSNTVVRVLGLLLDLIVMAACAWIFWTKI